MSNDEFLDRIFEGRPGAPGIVIRRHPTTGARSQDQLIWGLLPHGARDQLGPRPLLARAETVASHPMFADAFQRRRALAPATTVFLHGRDDIRYGLSRSDGQPLAWAALWEGWRGPGGEIIRSYCVVTCDANRDVTGIADRMPLILEPAAWPLWLGEIAGEAADLLTPPAPGIVKYQRIGGSRR